MNLLDKLNQEQKKAVTHSDGPLLIVAGAGTGKTTVIAERIGWLIEKKMAKSEEILALTFTEKAASEMEERVDRLLPYGYMDLWISTFHAFCERILRAHALDIGLPNDFKLLDTTDAWLLVRKNLHAFNLDYYRPLGNPTKFIHALIRHFSRAKDECITPGEYLEYVQNRALDGDSEAASLDTKQLSEVANAYHVYQTILLQENTFDFGDLINYTLKLFRERPNILEEYRRQFKYILVDEFQDTNIAQYELIKLLAAPKNNVTVVGDDDQSIYKFRGASISNILAFKKDYPDSREVFLVNNYRSKQNILDFSYKFIQLNNPYRLEYQLLENKAFGAENQGSEFSKKLIAQSEDPGIIQHIYADTHFDEARATVGKILELKEKDPESSWNDFAILARANDHANLFIRELADRGIPYQFLASRGLYSKPIILDTFSYLKLLDNYHESGALYRILNLPVWELSESARVELLHYASKKSSSLYAAMRQAATLGLTAKEINEIGKIIGMLEKHTERAARQKVNQIVFSFLSDTGYLAWLTAKEDQYRVEALRHLDYLWKKIQSFEVDEQEPTVKNFIARIALELEAGDEGDLPASPDEGPETVKILTIHAAKGLEFRYIFLVNLVDQRFPTRERKDAIPLPDALVKEITPEGDIHLQEERRLFYVACTRAKEGLFLTSAADYGGARARKPSRFLFESGILDEAFIFRKNVRHGIKNRESEIKNQESGIRNHGLTVETKELEGVLPKIHYELPGKLSFTQVKAFETCPLQYKFQHILKVPTHGRGTFSFGKSIHTTLQKAFQKYRDRKLVSQPTLFENSKESRIKNQESSIGDILTLEEFLHFYEESFIDDWFDSEAQKQEYYKKGKEALKALYAEVAPQAPEILGLEFGFNFKIADKPFKGAIDRVDLLADGTLEIIDYKTGKSKELESVDKDQLLIYQLAAKELFREPVGKLTFWYIDDGKKVSFLGAEKELAHVREKFGVIIEQIKTSTFPATPNEFKCKFCDYKDICEFRIL